MLLSRYLRAPYQHRVCKTMHAILGPLPQLAWFFIELHVRPTSRSSRLSIGPCCLTRSHLLASSFRTFRNTA